MENHSYADVIGNRAAPFINFLTRHGALLTNSYAVTHPSEPNYLALFSGSAQGVGDDSCPHMFRTANLGSELRARRLTFAGYSDGLPATGWAGCARGEYARKHNPWSDFANLPASVSKPFTAFPHDFTTLPTVSFVVPNLAHDMHDGSIATADHWLLTNLGPYITWARTHHSLLVLTWDEDDRSQSNRIPTIIEGQGVRTTRDGSWTTHYRILATLERMYGLPLTGAAARVAPLIGIWG